jgi:hypothetical protein
MCLAVIPPSSYKGAQHRVEEGGVFISTCSSHPPVTRKQRQLTKPFLLAASPATIGLGPTECATVQEKQDDIQ